MCIRDRYQRRVRGLCTLLDPNQSTMTDETATPTVPNVPANPASIYDFTVLDNKKQPYDLKQHAGKAVYFMNVASKCGYTKSGYEAATELFDKYGKGENAKFTVIAFPCNQFGSQEPGTEEEIKEFACSKFKADFPIMAKVDVNGDKEAPIFNYLKHKQTGILGTTSIKWNFTGFLTDTNGIPINRYSPGAKASEIEKDLLKVIGDTK
eukprot:TRINITY_DN4393_c0_g1_i13.p1 TRINITY_DN4393_c0_g1~~TRINITY_DN4393_c0_g1_i13.p1  ORF type:complete len:208 (-),score=101.00 TRINITY_DN4393_c0_g1_i13:102-725(-)